MLLGKDQLTFGVVPLGDGYLSAQSAKSVMAPFYSQLQRVKVSFDINF